MDNSSPSAAQGPRITINDLPLDVLLVILRDAYAFRQATYGHSWDPSSRHWQDDRDPHHPSAECLASVCPEWRAAMSVVSVFWTKVIIWLGTWDPTPLSRIRQYLAWSRAQPLDIYVLRRREQTMEDRTERARIHAIMELLLPHMSRWAILHLHLLHSSSLPLPGVDLVGHAKGLRHLTLQSIRDDPVDDTDSTTPTAGDFDTPVLHKLRMCGARFRESYMKRFLGRRISPVLYSVNLTNYASHHAPFPLVDLVAFLLTCGNLKNGELTLDNLHLDISYSGPPLIAGPGYEWVDELQFANMSADVIAEYHRLCNADVARKVFYTRCTLPRGRSKPRFLADSYSIVLYEIEDPDTLIYLYRGASASDVEIYSCGGLNREVLQELARPSYHHGVVDWPLQHLETLWIRYCKNVCSADIRAFVQARFEAHAATQGAVDLISELRVAGCGRLARDDKKWLNKNVDLVEWS
ncbi:uncharacterized protein C8Q71DRAFT_908627 [Rhodofomes roseus]|uniref:F-box domain-containing protein n=1 Tax=Rhodofomes roseus TaxID=34475 RepID=A0ABQ8KCD7_9APHY|nr:uncharacterized protein C8Q71DRAFT_908627 [Rhodofomes roseus]KAH9834760.1 hypothetical protein C8Q71DRAFT_908627 [Rhodofomes roseus]